MPKIRLSPEEVEELNLHRNPGREVSEQEYVEARNNAIAAVPDGDPQALREFLEKYPEPNILAEQELRQQELEAKARDKAKRQPKTKAEMDKFLQALEEVADGDSHGTREVLERFGMLAGEEDDIMERPGFLDQDDDGFVTDDDEEETA